MQFQDFADQSALIENLKRDFQSGQFVHAYLFSGAPGVGKRSLAGLCAQALFCTRPNQPCGDCVGCRRFEHENHPDVFRIRPERSIGVDAIRELIATIQLRAFDDGYKAVLIEQADRMTQQAQNCLLRTLEEPPANTVFFLTCDVFSAILPTLLSRSRVVRLAPLSREAMLRRLAAHGIAPERAALLEALAQGSVGKALDIERDEDYWSLRERVLRALFELTGSAALQAAAEFKEDRARAGQVLDIAETALGDALRSPLVDGGVSEQAYPPAWRSFARQVPAQAKLRLMRCAVEGKKMLSSNVALQAVLERLMINIAEENIACRW